MKYIDIHTHLNLEAFKDDYKEAAARAFAAGVSVINVGTEYETSKRAVELLDEFPDGVYATVGLHPTTAGRGGEVFDMDAYRELASHERVVAIGECGLDYFRNEAPEEHTKQVEVFEQHIALANEVEKPLMLHLRSGDAGNAYKDAYDILKEQAKVKGNSHFFAGSLEDAQRFWEMGYSTSFTGVITFARDYDEVVKAAPKELIHAETDAPYVTPKPHRGERNEPAYVVEVVKKMAELRGVSEDEWAEQLIKNARYLFSLT